MIDSSDAPKKMPSMDVEGFRADGCVVVVVMKEDVIDPMRLPDIEECYEAR